MASWEVQPLVNSFNKVFLGAAGTGAAGASVDDQFNRVSFLSHFDGANNGVNNAFDDGSSSNHTITDNGNVTQGSFSPFSRPEGEWGVSFNGSNDRLRTNASNLDITTEAFTAEAWIFPASSMDQYDIIVCLFAASHGSNANQTWSIRAGTNNTIEIVTIASGNQTIQSAGTANINAWNHVAISRNGTTMYAALNGAVTSKSCASSLNGHEYFYIGASDANGSGAYFFNGVISNVRYEIGNARYTSNYTVPTSKLTATTNTKILTCQSSRFVDNSASNNTFLRSGNQAAVTAFGPFLTDAVYDPAVNGASAYFDGTGDYLAAPTIVSESGNFTIEGWVYTTSTDGSQVICSQYAGSGSGRMVIESSSGSIKLFHRGQTTYTGSTTVTLNQWCHFVSMRTGNTTAFYVNGARVLNVSSANLYQGPFWIGNAPDINYLHFGYISNIRCTASAVYSEGASITVPTAPYPTVTNTNLLLNMADGQAIDSAAQNNLTLFGNTKTSTAQYKYGTSSLLLDGTGDYAVIYDAHTVGKGDFTIELWARRSATDNAGFFQFSAAALNSSSGAGPGIGVYEGGIYLYFGKTGALQAKDLGGTLPGVGTWFHVAYVRSSGVIQVYVNGTAYGATTDSTVDYTDSVLTLGGWYSSSFLFHGNIDDFRISHMARYTSNFTAPTKAFPDKGQ